jgi:hypothetical protein
MIKVKISDLINSTETLQKLSQKDFKAKLAWSIARLLKAAEAEIQEFNTARMNLIKKYGEKFAQNIIDGKACVGMTKEMCQIAMGRPNNTTRNTSSLGVVEVWTYSTMYELFGGLAPIVVVTFLDNKVTSVDEYKDNYPF